MWGHVKKAANVLLIITLLLSMMPIVQAEETGMDEFDVLREKWKTMLTGGSNYDLNDPNIDANIDGITQTAQSLWSSMLKATDRKSLWPGVTFGDDPGRITTTYNNLYSMALAYATIGSDLYQNQDMLQNIISGLEWMDAKIYNATAPAYQNWWHWEIGAPLALNNCTILIYEHLTDDQKARYMAAVAHYQNDIDMPGANREWECEVFTARGIIMKDASLLEMVRSGFSNLLGMVASGDGFYEDGSFIQHNFYPYNGGYGQSLIAGIANLLYILDGSSWDISEVVRSNVYRWVYDAYKPFIYKGTFMDMVRGREIARGNSGTDFIGHKVMSAILRLSMSATEDDAKAFKSMVKYWIQSNPGKDYFVDASNEMIKYATEILIDPAIQPIDEPIGYNQFYNMDRAVQLRPGYGLGISMFSNRIGNYESINSENQKSYHTADGMMYLYNNDLLQYSDSFWPTVNLFRLPGTTVVKNSTVSANVRSDQNWAGGTDLDGLYGASGMQLHTPGQTLMAKKSWFMFDNEIVSLGADINSTDGANVETIAENRKINGDNKFIVNGTEKPVSAGWNEVLQKPSWAHLEGNTQGSDIGYYFPEGTSINALRESRTGSWYNMATAGSKTPITSNYLTMWFDHGANPAGGNYSYVTLPGKTAEETNQYAQNPNVTILKNTPQVQAVKETTQNMTGANFWTDTVQSAGDITCNKKASVMTKDNGEELELSVSDPTQANTDWIDLEINKSATGIISANKNIVVKQLYPTIKLAVSVSGSEGKSFKAKFALVDPMPEQPLVKDTYIIDNTDSGFTTDGTAWTASYGTSGYYGINAAFDTTIAADTDRWAKWTPAIAKADTYDVYMRWVTTSNSPDAVPLEIKYDGGVDTSKIVNQKYNGGIWVYVGSYPLGAGADNYVKILASDEGNTCADAVKFVARNEMGNVPAETFTVQPPDKPDVYDIEKENFNQGNFTVENVVDNGNITKKIFEKDGSAIWTAELSSNTASFDTANPLYNDDLLSTDEGTASKKVNPTQYFSTEPGKLSRNNSGEDIRIFHNLPQKITTTDRLIYVDVRLKKSLSESITMHLCQDPMTSYSQVGSKTAASFCVSKYTPSLIYDPSKMKINSTKNFDFSEWIYVRTVIDLKNQKATMYCGETLENLQPWAGLGSDNTYTFSSTVNGISSFYFHGKGTLAMDDLHVYAVESDSSPQLANVVFDNGMLNSVDLLNPAKLPSTVTLTAVLYNDKGNACDVELLKDIAINQNETKQTILFNHKIQYKSGYQLKIFVFGNSNSIKPLTSQLTYPLE